MDMREGACLSFHGDGWIRRQGRKILGTESLEGIEDVLWPSGTMNMVFALIVRFSLVYDVDCRV